jgi:LuxR family maltose regulon positive regulatory protein
MDADSCNAVVGIKNSQDMLEELERENLFLTSLDEKQHWYQYHFLFREFLQSRLRRENGEQVKGLERSAGAY